MKGSRRALVALAAGSAVLVGLGACRKPVGQAAETQVTWSIPAVNYDLMLQEMLTKTAGKVIYWGRPLDWQIETLKIAS